MIVPNAALRYKPTFQVTRDADSNGVWTLSPEGTLKRIDVEVGISDELATEVIESDLKAGERVITGTRITPRRNRLFGIRLGI